MVLNRVSPAHAVDLTAEAAEAGAEVLDDREEHATTAALLHLHAERQRDIRRQAHLTESFTAAHPGCRSHPCLHSATTCTTWRVYARSARPLPNNLRDVPTAHRSASMGLDRRLRPRPDRCWAWEWRRFRNSAPGRRPTGWSGGDLWTTTEQRPTFPLGHAAPDPELDSIVGASAKHSVRTTQPPHTCFARFWAAP